MDLIEQRFGSLIVLDRVGNDKTGKRTWRCRCDCGSEIVAVTGNLRSGNTTCCGKGPCHSRALPGATAARNRTLDNYKRNAASRGLAWELTDERFDELVLGNCIYSGHGPSNTTKRYQTEPFVYNGIDRIDSSVGYVEGNVVSCCWICNLAKGSMSYNEFIEYLNETTAYRSAAK